MPQGAIDIAVQSRMRRYKDDETAARLQSIVEILQNLDICLNVFQYIDTDNSLWFSLANRGVILFDAKIDLMDKDVFQVAKSSLDQINVEFVVVNTCQILAIEK
jgi:hypothetical protein